MELSIIITALGMGIASGFHCVGMCGPIALSLGLSKKQALNFHLQNLTYQLGRVCTYTFLGALLGVVGKSFEIAGFQKYLTVGVGLLLILMAFFSFKGNDFASKIPFINKVLLKIKIRLGKYMQKADYSSRFLTGVLNGLLPCGMVYMALTASLAYGGIVQGASFMFFFGLGTLPFLFAVVLIGNLLTITIRTRVLKIFPFIMIIVGGLFVLRGLELGIPYVSPKSEALQIHQNMNHGTKHMHCH